MMNNNSTLKSISTIKVRTISEIYRQFIDTVLYDSNGDLVGSPSEYLDAEALESFRGFIEDKIDYLVETISERNRQDISSQLMEDKLTRSAILEIALSSDAVQNSARELAKKELLLSKEFISSVKSEAILNYQKFLLHSISDGLFPDGKSVLDLFDKETVDEIKTKSIGALFGNPKFIEQAHEKASILASRDLSTNWQFRSEVAKELSKDEAIMEIAISEAAKDEKTIKNAVARLMQKEELMTEAINIIIEEIKTKIRAREGVGHSESDLEVLYNHVKNRIIGEYIR